MHDHSRRSPAWMADGNGNGNGQLQGQNGARLGRPRDEDGGFNPLIDEVCRLFGRYGISYEQSSYILKEVRRRLGLVPRVRRQDRLPDVIPYDDFKRLLHEAEWKCELHALVLLLLWHSMVRVSELVHLDVADVDFKRGWVKIRGGKGGKDRLTVIPRWLARRVAKSLGNRASGPLLVSAKGRRMSARRVQQIVGDHAIVALPRRRVTCHTFRRSMATYLLNRGMREEALSTLLGHSSTEITRAAYARLEVGRLAREYAGALYGRRAEVRRRPTRSENR